MKMCLGRNDRNAGGRQRQAAAPIPADMSDPDDGAGDDDPHSEPGQLEPGESGNSIISRIVIHHIPT